MDNRGSGLYSICKDCEVALRAIALGIFKANLFILSIFLISDHLSQLRFLKSRVGNLTVGF